MDRQTDFGGASASVAEFRAGIEALIRAEDLQRARAAQERNLERHWHIAADDPKFSWRDTLARFDSACSTAARLLSKHPRFFTPYTFGLLHELTDPGAAHSFLKQAATQENLLRALRRIEGDHELQFPSELRATTEVHLFTYGRKQPHAHNGRSLTEPAETLVFHLLALHWRSRIEGQMGWMRIVETALCWGWRPKQRHQRRSTDGGGATEQERTRNAVVNRVKRLRAKRYRQSLHTIVKWHQREYENGFGPGLSLIEQLDG